MKCVPWLPEEPAAAVDLDLLPVRAVMHAPVVTLRVCNCPPLPSCYTRDAMAVSANFRSSRECHAEHKLQIRKPCSGACLAYQW